MPKRTDIKSVLIIGAGPIVIGQACEFDYSGTQSCKALKEEGYRVILVNSNPATIMTDPELADATYIEPVTPEVVARIIEIERPDALLPTMGGQTALNVAKALAENGTLEKFGVELIGAKLDAINKAEDRNLFKEAMTKIGLESPKSELAHNMDEAFEVVKRIGYPIISRPAFTLGGTGGGIAYNETEFIELVRKGLEASPTKQLLLEESIYGWKEFELEVVRDKNDNVIIICSIENFDPMGVHTGDSITVAPAQTLTDVEYQALRDAAIKIIREIGVDTGGSNVQFGLNPNNGRIVVIEMNPRVSRSSALASKATGFPIARIATKLAVGYTLDELPNDITKTTPASFEPTLDYVITKIPRWAFEKFPHADTTLTTQMKSVGEVMGIGRTFKESFQKAIRSLETDRYGFGFDAKSVNLNDTSEEILLAEIKRPNSERLYYIWEAFRRGKTVEDIFELSRIDRWFLSQLHEIYEYGVFLGQYNIETVTKDNLSHAKKMGFSDRQLAHILGCSSDEVSAKLVEVGLSVNYKLIDTCAGEFESTTPYFYSTHDHSNDDIASSNEKVIILSAGPNRIGQGIEFDYCCVHASLAIKDMGYDAIMVNSNPETVSTDYDISSKLYFEPLTFEDVMNIVNREKPKGVIIQLGGQTPLKLAKALNNAGVNILGTSVDSIDLAEDRERFAKLLDKLNIPSPAFGTANSVAEAKEVAHRIGYPVMVRPSYVLGGRGMEIVYDDKQLEKFVEIASVVNPEHPVFIDQFLENAIEMDVDCIGDGQINLVAGIMEHIEEAGIHSGDSACILPPQSIPEHIISIIRSYSLVLAHELRIKGLMNIQFAYKNDIVYVIEVNPRASRTVPFVSKAIDIPLPKIATQIMLGKTLKELGIEKIEFPKHISVKEVVLPFNKFPGVDIILGPEMRSTGEVMGIADNFGEAFAKAQLAASQKLPLSGNVFITLNDRDKQYGLFLAEKFKELGFSIFATEGTAKKLISTGFKDVTVLEKIYEGRNDNKNAVGAIKAKNIQLIINTPLGKMSNIDDREIRMAALAYNVPVITTVSGAKATAEAIKFLQNNKLNIKPLQKY